MDVGNIVATLTLKKGEWDSSIAAAKKDNKDLGGFVLNNEASFKKMGTAMTVAGAAVVGSIGMMIKSYVTAGDEIDKMSKRTSFSATSLSELKYALDIAGGSIEGLETGIKIMSNTIVDADRGLATAKLAFDDLGISIEDLKGLSPEEQFFTIANAIAGVENPALQSALAVDMFGRSGTQLLPLLKEGSVEIDRLRKEAHTLGIVFDTEAAAKAAKLKDAQEKLSASIKGVGFTIAQTLVPPLTSLVGKVSDVIVKVQEWTKAHLELTSWITKGALAIGGLMMVLGPLMIALPTLVKSFGLLKVALLPVGTAAMVVGSAIGGWNLGKLIGEMQLFGTSINTYMTDNFNKLFNVMGLYKGSAEKATDAEVLLATATKIAGEEVTNKAKAMEIIKQKYAETGTVGNKMLDDWAKGATEADKTHSALMMTVAQQTEKIIDNKEAIKAAKEETERLTKELGLTFASDIRNKISDIEKGLALFGDALPVDKVQELRKELIELRNSLIKESDLPPSREWIDLIENAPSQLETAISAQTSLGQSIWDMQMPLLAVSELHSDVYKGIGEETKEIGFDWEGVSEDISRYWQTGIADMIAGTSSFGDFVKNSINIVGAGVGSTLGKAATSALSGLGAIAGPIGSVVAGVASAVLPAVGSLLGIKSKAEKQAESLANQQKAWNDAIGHTQDLLSDLGPISKKTSEQINEMAKNMAGYIAVDLMFSSIIKDVGVNQENVNELWSRATDIIGHMTNGEISAVDATKSLDASFGLLLEGTKELGEEGSAAMVQFILKVRESGIEVKSVTEYVISELDRIPKSLESLILTQEKTGDSIEGLELKTLAAFNAMQASGMNWTDIVHNMSPAINALRDRMEATGNTGSEAIQKLFKIAEVTDKNKELFDAIQAENEIMEALGNTGFMTQEIFTSFTDTAQDQFKKLQIEFGNNDDALRAMGPTLQNIYDYAKTYGIQIDDNTASLIDQANELGIVKDVQKENIEEQEKLFDNLGDRIASIMDDVGTKISSSITDAFKNAFRAAEKSAESSVSTLNNVFSEFNPIIDIEYDYPDLTLPKGKGSVSYEQHGFEELVTRPTYYNFIAGEAGPELVSVKNRSQMQEAGMIPQQNKPTNVINLYLSSWDSRDTERWVRGEGKNMIVDLFRQNTGGISEKTETYLKTYRK